MLQCPLTESVFCFTPFHYFVKLTLKRDLQRFGRIALSINETTRKNPSLIL